VADSAPADPYSSAKYNIRDTIKWLATTLSGLVAAVVAGASITGLSGMHGAYFWPAIFAGLAGLLCLLWADAIALQLLMSRSFFFGQLDTDDDLRTQLNKHARDFLPPEIPTVDDFITSWKQILKAIADNKARPDEKPYKDAVVYSQQLTPEMQNINRLANFVVLVRSFDEKKWKLFALAVAGILGLGLYAILSSAKPDAEKDPNPVTVSLNSAKGWADLGSAYTQACSDAAMKLQSAGA